MNSINPIDPLFSSGNSSSFMNPMAGAGNFGNVFDQAMSHSHSRAESAKIAWLQGQYFKQNVLYGMFSDPKTSVLGFGMSDLFGTGGPFGLPSWTYDAQRLMGKNHDVQNIMNIGQQASMLIQSRLNQGLGSLGSLGRSFSSLI